MPAARRPKDRRTKVLASGTLTGPGAGGAGGGFGDGAGGGSGLAEGLIGVVTDAPSTEFVGVLWPVYAPVL